MSANFTPEELKKIAPDEYARIYGEDKPTASPPDINRAKLDEARRLEAETRLINAKRRHAAALARQQDNRPNGSTRAARGVGYFIIAVIIALVQIALCVYLTLRY